MTREEYIKKILAIKTIDIAIIDTWDLGILENTLQYLREERKLKTYEEIFGKIEQVDEYINGINDYGTSYINGIRQRRRG